MAQSVSKRGLPKALEEIKRRPQERQPSVLGFFLFDERQSHRVVQDFARRQFDWLDKLAASTGMVLFFFLPERDPVPDGGAESQILVTEGDRIVENPSLDVASRFGLAPLDLPGVVFFTELDLERAGPHDGVYWPLELELFEQDPRDAEDEFSRLFFVIQRARTEAANPGELLAALRRGFEAEERSERARPILAALRVGAVKLVTFPGTLLEATSIAFGQELARRSLGG